MSVIDEMETNKLYPNVLKPGGRARIIQTGQIVELKRVSDQGISLVSFSTGGDYFISNKFLEPVFSRH